MSDPTNMPTPFETVQPPESEWAARSDKPGRSVFGNYKAETTLAGPVPAPHQTGPDPAASSAGSLPGSAMDAALARSFIHRFLALCFEDPTEERWTKMANCDCREVLQPAIHTLAIPAITEAARTFQAQLVPEAFDSFLTACLAAFGHAARGRCPLNEIEYGDIKADPLFQPHRLADLAAFYRAFGLEVAGNADERHDHICMELEFMCVLTAKEAYALGNQLNADAISICRDAQKRFLRDHLGRWTPAFTRRLARMAAGTPLEALANLTRSFIESECALFGVTPGSEDLLLRPVDAASETMCDSCGLNQLPPGALPQSPAAV